MSRKWLVVAVVALLGTIIAVALSMRTASVDTNTTEQHSELPYQGLSAEIRTDSVTELLVEFGDVPYSSVAVKQVRLKNTTDTPLALVDYRATCRCTWIELPQQAIAPNEWAEAEVKFDSRGEFGSVGNYIEVSTSDERCIIAVWMSADVI